MKRRFEEGRIDRLQQLVNEVAALSGMEEETIEVRPYRYIPKILFNILMIVEIYNIWSLNYKIRGFFHFVQVWYEGNQYAVKYALEYVQHEPYIIVVLPIVMLFLYFLQLHLQKQDVREVIARADEELAKWEHTPSAEIPHSVKALKYHLEELRLDYDLS
ncbi:hypothetical protein NQ540_08735 [Granulicatella adiacens ATCC 49175]|uniref:Uncharacterized protein n=1 Tax=Granulicatella adiacens ATCC 49175 TaxID=638301 RepID=C8NII6_9LACT|nr:hypothetical protein [Granulicatella adiacens]EEW36383.1 hypothetical protein HMPREF0444_1731 [Granulicatella adiacens ATCC 49175]UAK93040.1 hypothetical protein K8O88_05855 [Granulicatella adiacens]UWP37971.1 hypothetical protein NQ540_08735 [Granulicatella adiacens ATCC 49175]